MSSSEFLSASQAFSHGLPRGAIAQAEVEAAVGRGESDVGPGRHGMDTERTVVPLKILKEMVTKLKSSTRLISSYL